MSQQRGFSLVELIAVIVLLAILGGVFASRMISQKVFELQAGRDLLISAFFLAQQTALHQGAAVRLITSASSVDVRQDNNSDGMFTADESIRRGGLGFPLQMPVGVNVSGHSFDYDRLGRTAAATVSLTKGDASVQISVSATGYAH